MAGKRYPAEFRGMMALDAIRSEQTIERMVAVFSGKVEAGEAAREAAIAPRHAKTDQLVMKRVFCSGRPVENDETLAVMRILDWEFMEKPLDAALRQAIDPQWGSRLPNSPLIGERLTASWIGSKGVMSGPAS